MVKQWSLLLSMCALLVFSTVASWADDFANIPKITVSGEGSIFQPADQMEATLGVVIDAETQTAALAENNQRMNQIIANLRALGLDESDYQTGHFYIRPIYQKAAKGSGDEHGKISHYEVINAIKIKTQKLDLADKILSAAVEGGANQVDQVNFNLNNPQAYREAAIKLAAKNALANAAALASAAGVKIKRVLNLSVNHWFNSPAPLALAKRSEALSSAEGGAQNILEPGKTEIHATVNATLEIGN